MGDLIVHLLYRRFKSLKSIEKFIRAKTNDNVLMIFSESERIVGGDFMIDIEIGDCAYTIYYLRDNSDYIFITEV